MRRFSFVFALLCLTLLPMPAMAADAGFLDLALNPLCTLSLAFLVGGVASAPMAKHQPIRKARKEVLNTDAKIPQPTDVVTDPEDPLDLDPDIIVVSPEEQRALKRQHYERLKFDADWLTILIGETASDENIPQYTDFVACQGATPMMRLRDGTLVPPNGYLPRGVEITIQRKFVEQMLRAKKMKVSHAVTPDMKNELKRELVPSLQISLIGASAEDQDWFRRLSYGRG